MPIAEMIHMWLVRSVVRGPICSCGNRHYVIIETFVVMVGPMLGTLRLKGMMCTSHDCRKKYITHRVMLKPKHERR